MNKIVFIVLAIFVGVALTAPQGDTEDKDKDKSKEKEMEIVETEKDDSQAYNYNWGVNDSESKNYYGQEQSSNDAGRVEGKYYVWLADGRLMTVSYYVDGDSGFVPTITFSDPGFNPPADAPARPE